MNKVKSIGNVKWEKQDIINSLDEFLELYDSRPIKDNSGGMKSPHLFAVWFMAKQINPELIVESGVWKGQSTWLLEQACPNAKLVSIDINLKNREYFSKKAEYSDRDFSEQDWKNLPENSLVFFDDHQNAYKRLQQCKWFGFRHVIFEDNYPPAKEDCYSLKKAFSNAGYTYESKGAFRIPEKLVPGVNKILRLAGIKNLRVFTDCEAGNVMPNNTDAVLLERNLETYYEFPPVFRTDKTRWEDDWENENYPTPEPVLKNDESGKYKVFLEEAGSYTWICYAKLS